MRKIIASIFSVMVIFAFSYQDTLADGIIIPDPPICDPCPIPPPFTQLSIRYHHVTVTIKDQIVKTYVDQVFYNPNDWTIEGEYIFPIPKGATVNNFTLWIDDQPVAGEILAAEDARRTYEQIVSTMRDPALLEYADMDAVKARIFPVPPHGERRIELEYSQILVADNGLVQYTYPLGTEKFSVEPLESVSINLEIDSNQPIRAVYSPSHDLSIHRESDYFVVAGYEELDVLPDRDFSLIYSLGESQAFHLFTFRDRSDGEDADGYFLLLLAPPLQASEHSIAKDVLVVVDQSGSMEGEKFAQAQQALRYILSHLNPEDRFNIIAFSTGVDLYSPEMSSAADADQAVSWVNRLRAEGSTDINRALLEAASLVDGERPAYLLFLTDGLPTVGEVESDRIIQNLQEFAPQNLSMFPFGVGYDVDTYLLDSLAQQHHGTSTYVLPGEDLEETLSGFYSKIRTPVLTNLDLDFGDLQVKDIYPYPLPDLFSGSQVAVVGRYEQGEVVDVTLSGKVNNRETEFVYPDQYFTDGLAFRDNAVSQIPGLWATRKIGYLLQQIRLHGPEREILDEIVRLSIRFGIVTPYTSYLVTEPAMLGVEQQERIVEEELQKFNDLAQLPTFGREAVEQAEGHNSLASAEVAPTAPNNTMTKMRVIDNQTFINSEGTWIDTRFDPQRMETIEIEFLSDQYFSLVRTDPSLAKVFALGPEVIALFGEDVYQVVDHGVEEGVKAEATPTAEAQIVHTPTGVQSVSSDSEGTAFSQLPCMSGLAIAVLPFIMIGLLSIKRKSGSTP